MDLFATSQALNIIFQLGRVHATNPHHQADLMVDHSQDGVSGVSVWAKRSGLGVTTLLTLNNKAAVP